MFSFTIIWAILFVIFAPVVGCFLAGLDRKITARFQGRVGPPLLQPLYDVRKLIAKEDVSVNSVMDFYVAMALLFAIIAGALFFSGMNLLMVIFVLTLSSLFFIIAAYSARSPFSDIGAQREILQVLSYEPAILLMAVGFYLVTGSFNEAIVFFRTIPVIAFAPLVFVAVLFVLTIKLRKSPFDLSYSHHAHQELVKGITTEMSGKTLAMVEIMHWYENVLFFGWIALFILTSSWVSWIIALLVVAFVFMLEIFIDNNSARVKWQTMFKSAWIVTLIAFVLNIGFLYFV
jgi:ech hydrogenase subunit B